MNRDFQMDYYRMTGKKWSLRGYIHLLTRYDLRYLLFLRTRKKGRVSSIQAMAWNRKHGLEVLTHNVGKGLYLGHAHNISVNPAAVIGDNCNLNKGATIGVENRGRRKGAPVLGNCVWVGSNATVVGNVTIGDDVLIAPNAFVNTDVPPHSIVVGNPGVITPRDNATEAYVCYRV